MSELISAGISALLLGLAWRFLLKKSILDLHRDRLFDLRDELRTTFISNGWSLDDQMYRRLRDLINGYLRFTEHFALAETIYFNAQVSRNPELRDEIKDAVSRRFRCKDQKQQEYVSSVRQRALDIMVDYMMLSSGPVVILLAVTFPFMLSFVLTSFALRAIVVRARSVATTAEAVIDVMAAMRALTVAYIGHKLFKEDVVEDSAYNRGHTPACA
jgi:hypothetical protein